MALLGINGTIQYFFFQKILRINGDVPWPVHWTSRVANPRNIKKKAGYSIGAMPGCYIQAINGIMTGENLWVGPGVKIISADHDVCNYNRHVSTKPVTIGDNCWLGSNCVILPGVELGDHTIVAAGAIVNKSFTEGNVILAGVPAKIVKHIPPYESEQVHS